MLTVRRGQLTYKKLDLEGTELEVKFLEMIWNFEFVIKVGRKITTVVWLCKVLGKLRILIQINHQPYATAFQFIF
jgi:hypothetical protein